MSDNSKSDSKASTGAQSDNLFPSLGERPLALGQDSGKTIENAIQAKAIVSQPNQPSSKKE